MNNVFVNFLLGLLCTGGLFALCVLVVVGGKVIYLALKERFFPNPEQADEPPQAPVTKRRKKSKSISTGGRSIEIDASEVDRIYVKKIS